jgi:hypothetical protein
MTEMAIAKTLMACGTPTFLAEPVQVELQKIAKSPAKYVGCFIRSQDSTKLVEIKVYSPTFIIIVLYKKGEQNKSETFGMESEALTYISGLSL